MGSIHRADVHKQDHQRNGICNRYSRGQFDDVVFESFGINGLATAQDTTPTGLRHEILLLSWLIVLLRTQEESQVCFDWACKSQQDGFEPEPTSRRLSMEEVMTGLQDNVKQVAAAISLDVATAVSNQHAITSDPAALLLSTSSLSRTSEEAKDEVGNQSVLVTTLTDVDE